MVCLVARQAAPGAPPIAFTRIPSPVIFQGDPTIAYRDPAAFYHEGTFHLFFSLMEIEPDGKAYWYTASSTSADLIRWTAPKRLTPRDRNLNFSSPGNVVRFGGKFVLSLQTYPTPNGEVFGNETARVWTMRSNDLAHWEKPEMLMVTGPGVPVEKMGRMIDPFLLEDKDEPGKWWCFYKQNGVSMSWSRDLRTWTYSGHANAGENVCVLVEGDEYILFHSPRNGIGVKRSRDLKEWRDGGLLTLGQQDWPWAQRRLTAGFVLDMRKEPGVGRYLMFFHGDTGEGPKTNEAHGQGTLGLAWSDDLLHWDWPGK
jgi:hypothetical protein